MGENDKDMNRIWVNNQESGCSLLINYCCASLEVGQLALAKNETPYLEKV